MNISKIWGLNPTTQQNNVARVHSRTHNFNISLPKPITHDTVSFSGTAKSLNSRKDGVSRIVAHSIQVSAEPMQKKIIAFMTEHFGDLLVTELKPANPILKISNRVKTANSIVEKSATRGWNKKSEIFANMTDINGVKIVMRDGRKDAVEKVLSRFIKLIEKGNIELIEIENKRPKIVQNLKSKKKEQFDYAHSSFLENLQNIQEQKWTSMNLKEKREVKLDLNDYTDMNYMAIHFLFKFPEETRPFELMIMGKDINALKDLDDKLFKVLNNKNIDKKYKQLAKLVRQLQDPGNKDILEKFNQYRRDAFIFQRRKEPTSYVDKNVMQYFLPLTYDIPPEYDLNNLYRIMLECDAKAKVK